MSFPHSIADGRYTLVEPLGVGGMATVFKAFDQRLQVWRAIKILSPQYSNRPSLKDRFEAEARTTALLEHRHIVKVYDVGRSNGSPYIVMELVEGGTLVDWVKRHGPMPPRMAVGVSIQAAEGVGAAHARKVVHRDVKPHNVLITNEGVCRITDFGIARVGDESDGLTRTGAVFGTWAYMAPEQRSDAKKVDARADVYSLGATLYFLLTGRTPVDLFAAEKDLSVLDGIPDALVPALIQATQYARNERYESVHAFAAGLNRCLEHLPPDPPDTPPLARPAEPLPKTWAAHPEGRAVPDGGGAHFGETMVPDAEGEAGYGGFPDMAGAFADSDQPSSQVSNGSGMSVELPYPDPTGQGFTGGEGFRDGGGARDGLTPHTRTQPDVHLDAGRLDAGHLNAAVTPQHEGRSRVWWIPAVVILLLVVGVVLLRNLSGTQEGRPPADQALTGPSAGPSTGPSTGPTVGPSNPGLGPAGADDPQTSVAGPPPAEGGGEGSPTALGGEGSSATPPDAEPGPAGALTTDPTRPPNSQRVEPRRTRVSVTGDAAEVRFSSGGKVSAPGVLAPGTWLVEARFGEGGWNPAGEITLRAGESATVQCTAAFFKCRKL